MLVVQNSHVFSCLWDGADILRRSLVVGPLRLLLLHLPLLPGSRIRFIGRE